MIDVAANRSTSKWTLKEKMGRVLWALASPFWRASPRICWSWRRTMLRLFGAQIGANVHIYPTARIAIPWNLQVEDFAAIGDYAIIYSLGKIHLKARATVSQYAHLCAGTHDWRDKAMPLLKPPITIGEDVWICAEAFVGPGVYVGARAIVGARAVVTKDIPADQIVVGNPGKQIGLRQP